MGLFGPRRPCANCGKKVKQPSDTANFLCPHCGKPGPWASAEQISGWQREQAELERIHHMQSDAQARYGAALAALASGASTDAAALPTLAAETGYSPGQLAQTRTKAFADYLHQAAGDDILTPEEEDHVNQLVQVLGIDVAAFLRQEPDLARRVLVAEANGGFLPEVPSSQLVQKKGEVVHLEVQATLLKDVTIHESKGGYSGFSFPIGKTGIRYRIGGYRGHGVEVGTKRVPADSGVLVISSQRAVFLGSKHTMELPYAKLVNLTVFSDGVQFHESNRQTAPVFVVPQSDVVAAFVHAAARSLNS